MVPHDNPAPKAGRAGGVAIAFADCPAYGRTNGLEACNRKANI